VSDPHVVVAQDEPTVADRVRGTVALVLEVQQFDSPESGLRN